MSQGWCRRARPVQNTFLNWSPRGSRPSFARSKLRNGGSATALCFGRRAASLKTTSTDSTSLRAAALATGLDEREIEATLLSAQRDGSRVTAIAPQDFAAARDAFDGGPALDHGPDNGDLLRRGEHDQPSHGGRGDQGTTFPMLSVADLAALPEPAWLLEDLLPVGFNVLFGPSNVGKSFLALDWALCIASGIPWFGQQTEAGTVVYIAAEGVAGIYRRVQAWEHARSRPAPDRIRFIPHAANLLERSDVVRIVTTIAQLDDHRC